jgi:hypothetical protein
MTKTGMDAFHSSADNVESMPVVGNMVSAFGAASYLGAAGFDSLMGDKDGAHSAMNAAEDNALNAIPGVGNYRAYQQSQQDAQTLHNDLNPAINPADNQSAESKFDFGGGAEKLNQSAGAVSDQLFGA